MTRKGGSKHLKRLPAPSSWPIHRKEFRWVVKPRPGPHSIGRSLPLLLIVREILGLVKTRREAKIMLSEGNVKLDGKVMYEDDYPIGIMDLLEIPAIKKAFRVLPSRKALQLHTVGEDEKDFKLCKIVGKTTIRGGHLQLNLHDGKNVLVKVADPKQREEDVYSVYDVLKIGIPNHEILAHLKLEEGALGIIEDGKNAGVLAEVIRIGKRGLSPASVALRESKGNQFETIIDYVFPIGKGEAWITLPEEE
jgi:small subunit ribosomal protein S4e